MDYLPLFVRLEGRPALVVGGGAVASRKVAWLRRAGARVTVNAPRLHPELADRMAAGEIRVEARDFDPALVPGHWLVVAATSDPAVNGAVAAAAEHHLRLCNVVDDPVPSTFISPAVVDRSPVLVAVSSGGRSPVLARLVRQQIEALLAPNLGTLADWARRWRQQVAGRLVEGGHRRRFWTRILTGPPARDLLAGRTDRADAALAAALDEATARPTHPGTAVVPGEAWLVGAGPGDPELITLKGLKVLQEADVILHDRLASGTLLEFARRDAELIDVGKEGGGPGTDQDTINRLLVERVRAGQRVVRLKGGDPFVFGRGSEELEALARAGLTGHVIPGITAATGCGAAAGIPLTHRGLAGAVTLVTARAGTAGSDPDWARYTAPDQTLVVYMPLARLHDIAEGLVAAGRDPATPAAVVAAGTTDRQQVVRDRLDRIAARAADLPSPALLYVGAVAGFGTPKRATDGGVLPVATRMAAGALP